MFRYKGQSLRYLTGRGNQQLHCGTVCGGGVREGTMVLTGLLAGFHSLPPLPTSKLGPSGADFWVGGSRTLWVSPTNSPVRSGVSPAITTPTGFLSQRFEALFTYTGTLGFPVCSIPQLFLPVYLHANVCLSGPPDTALLVVISTPAACLCHAYRSG